MKYVQNILFIILGILIALAAFFLIRNKVSEFTIKTNSTTVVQQIRSLNRLETSSYTIEKVIDAGTSGGKFEQFLFGDRILLIAHGEVIAGIDMAKITDNDIQIEKDSISLALPAPQILTTRLDSEQTKVFDRQTGVLTKGNKDLEAEARKAAEETIREAACKGNILQAANENARKQLTAFLKALQFKKISIDIDMPTSAC
jgi:hypothetical protein